MQYIQKVLIAVGMLFLCGASYAGASVFSIVPVGTLPTTVSPGGSVNATYTITNNTSRTTAGDYVKYLPPNVTQSGGSCGNSFTLPSHASCTLQLTVTGPVNASDPNPRHHLFVCLSDGTTCSGTNYPLNVTESSGGVEHAFILGGSGGSGAEQGGLKLGEFNSITSCSFDGSGDLTDCNTVSLESTTVSPSGVALNPAATGLYITDPVTGKVVYCTVATDGTVSDCHVAAEGLTYPNGITVNHAGTRVYVVTDEVSVCSIEEDGSLTECETTGNDFELPQSIALNSDNTKAYITNLSNNTVSVCDVAADTGALTDCQDAGAGNISEPLAITLNATGSFAYLTDYTHHVYNCPIAVDGSFSGCSYATDQEFSYAPGIALNSAGTNGYVTDALENLFFNCDVNSVDGNFDSCTSIEFTNPVSIAIG